MTDYNASAELYPGRHYKHLRVARYQRFPSLAEAVQYAIEQLPLNVQPSSFVESDEVRYDGDAVRQLYFSDEYPLRRAFANSPATARTRG